MRLWRFYSGLGLLTFSTLALEIIQTRLLSVMTWYYLAFFVISIAMFGMTAGAVWVYLRRDTFGEQELSYHLTMFTSAFAVATALSLLLEMTLAPTLVFSLTMVVVFAEVALVMAIPFFFSGVAVSLALTRSPCPVGRVYAADLAGAALGCLGVLWLLDRTDAPSAILLSAAAAAGAATLFSGSRIGRWPGAARGAARLLARPRAILVALLACGLLNGATIHGIQPILVKDSVEKRIGRLLYERWNSFSRVTAQESFVGRPMLWGPSSALPADLAVEQIYLTIDGSASTTMFRFHGKAEEARFLAYDVTNLPYFLRSSGRAAVIGVGSGRDLLSAWHFGLRDVTGVEINPIFVDLLSREPRFARFAGLGSLEGVRLVVDEARSWFARTEETFDLIQMSMIDTWAATGAGAFTLSENGLYTIEAWTSFLKHLTPGGLFTVSRWYDAAALNETGRMISLAVASLLESGASQPHRHIAVAASDRVATLLMSPSPLSSADLATLRRMCERFRYRLLVAPDGPAPASDVLRQILAADGRAALERFTSGLELDLSPPTDDRPFFFNALRLTRSHRVLRFVGRIGVGNLMATATLVTIILVSAGLVVLTIVVPLRSAAREIDRALAAGGTLFFALLGLGFMFVEVGLLQRLSIFLGHPIYSLSTVLFSLILSTGAGSLASEGARIERRMWRLIAWSSALGLYLVTLPSWLPTLLRSFESASLPTRVGLSVGVIVPAGLLMGFGFPSGMRLVQGVDSRPTPWFWGINGAAGVLASAAAVALSIACGINVTLIVGGLSYLALIPAVLILRRHVPSTR